MSEHDEYIPSEPTKIVVENQANNTFIEMTENFVSEPTRVVVENEASITLIEMVENVASEPTGVVVENEASITLIEMAENVASDPTGVVVENEASITLIEMVENVVSETNTLLSLHNEAKSNLDCLEDSLSEMLIESAEKLVSETVPPTFAEPEYTQIPIEENIITSVIENVVTAVSTLMVDTDPATIVESVDNKTLASILQNVLLKTDGLDKYSIQLTPEIKHIFNLLVTDSKYFDDVEKSLKLIIQDDKIDAKDVPQIMVLLTNLYSKLRGLRIEFNEKICGDMLKFVFDVAIKDGLIKMNKADMELLTCVYSIIDMSIQLIQTDKFPTKVVGILSCIYKSFFARK